MSNIVKDIYGNLLIDGELTNDDINFLNRIETNITVIFKNTKGLSSNDLAQINNSRINFRVIGGLEMSKAKYDNEDYQYRTYYSKEELKKIIEYFEDIEKNITSEMSELEKCMYIYCCIIKDTNYVGSYRDDDTGCRAIETSLTGNLYHKLTCAGIALTYKELLDRQGIKCDYLNKRHQHSFNRIEIDGKKYGIDLTWDLNRYEREGVYAFDYFGRQDTQHFYVKYHNLKDEPDETMDELNTFSYEELINIFNQIKPMLDNHKKHVAAIESMSREEKIKSFEILHFYNEVEKEAVFIDLIKFLKERGAISLDDYRVAFANKRGPIVFDIVGGSYLNYHYYNVEGIDGSYRYALDSELEDNNFYKSSLEAIDKYIESYIKDFFDIATIYAESFRYVSAEENEELYIYYCGIKNKIEYFNSIRNIVTEMGYGEELNYFNFVLNREETKRKQEIIEKQEVQSQYDYDYDFLFGILSADEMLSVKDYIEFEKGKEISIDEFKEMFTNPYYMRQIFNKHWEFNDEELYVLLNEVYNEKLDEMIKLNERRSLNKEQPDNKSEMTVEENNNGFDDDDFDTYDEEWNKSFI